MAAVFGTMGCCDAGCGLETSPAAERHGAAAAAEVLAGCGVAESSSALAAVIVLAEVLAVCAALGSLLLSAESGAAEWSAEVAGLPASVFGRGGAAAVGAAVHKAAGLGRRLRRWRGGMPMRSCAAVSDCEGQAAVVGASATCGGELARSLPQGVRESRLLRLLSLERLDDGRRTPGP